jgi:hypothetical protein
MAKKRRSRKKQKEPKAPETPLKVSAQGQDTPPDFGGLPDIDFKKNMGCG